MALLSGLAVVIRRYRLCRSDGHHLAWLGRARSGPLARRIVSSSTIQPVNLPVFKAGKRLPPVGPPGWLKQEEEEHKLTRGSKVQRERR